MMLAGLKREAEALAAKSPAKKPHDEKSTEKQSEPLFATPIAVASG